jgi:nitrate reductase alpha subunit
VVSQRIREGTVFMYHAQEKIVNTPGSEITGKRGGIHNSVTRAILKPTHMIGGYAQLSYGFNYYGTVGSNRDEFVIVRKDGEGRLARYARSPKGDRRMKVRAQIGMVLNLDKCIGCHTCSVTCKNVWTSREGVEYAWFNNVETKPGIGYPKDWENQKRWNGGWRAQANGKIEPRMGAKWRILAKIFANPDLPEIDDYYEPFDVRLRAPADRAGDEGVPDRAAALADHRRADGEDRVGPELGGDPRRRVRQALEGLQLRRHPEGHLRPVRKHLHDVPAAPVRALPQPDLRRRPARRARSTSARRTASS